MKVDREDILLAVAKLIWEYEITIDEFYHYLGVDLKNYRADATMEVAELAGILTGWKTGPKKT